MGQPQLAPPPHEHRWIFRRFHRDWRCRGCGVRTSDAPQSFEFRLAHAFWIDVDWYPGEAVEFSQGDAPTYFTRKTWRVWRDVLNFTLDLAYPNAEGS